MTLSTQFYTLFMMIVGGTCLGGLFDFIRVGAGPVKKSRWIMGLLDLLYWCLATSVIFRLLYISNYAQIRGFIFIGLCAGVLLYMLLLQSAALKIWRIFFTVVEKIAHVLARTVYYLIWVPLITLWAVLVHLAVFFSKLAMYIYRFMIQWCYPLIKKWFWWNNKN